MMDTQWVKSVDKASFVQEVLEQSKTVPVLVDFWATWCGPCRTLGPILEKLANEMKGRFILAKIDSDHNPELARQYGVRGIPSVKLFMDKVVVNEFTGALPESRIRDFLDKALPSEQDKWVARGREAEERNDLEGALELYHAVLSAEPAHVAGLLGLTRVLLALGRIPEANETFARVKPRDQESVEARNLKAKLAFVGIPVVDQDSLAAKVAENPSDLAARLALGEALVAQEQYALGLEQFLEVVRANRTFQDDAGRKAVIRVFDLLGPGHPLIAQYRPRLSALLFA
ncbi:MAG: tetratricopeptide repeat protein [Magnetococcales bacterium]|nr:tetratricopeptide repeat protein [Magnetococcales bacterium]MBF0439833.1 tetratricopeptide repeat protein [Magnetococcales bacterium]